MSYNEQVGNLDLVLFNDALNHLSIAHRILRLQGSHALLVGVSGSGKKALAKLAAFIAGLRTFEISLSKSYGEQDLCEDIKRMYTMMAENTDQYMFIFTDSHVRSEGKLSTNYESHLRGAFLYKRIWSIINSALVGFLEFVNNILTTGCQVSLFSEEDKDGVINTVWPKAEAALKAIGGPGAAVTKETVWKWFARDCTSRLHMALCMSPVGEDLRSRCRNFPGIVNCTTIDWYFPWPEQALYAVACSLINPKVLNMISWIEHSWVTHLASSLRFFNLNICHPVYCLLLIPERLLHSVTISQLKSLQVNSNIKPCRWPSCGWTTHLNDKERMKYQRTIKDQR